MEAGGGALGKEANGEVGVPSTNICRIATGDVVVGEISSSLTGLGGLRGCHQFSPSVRRRK